MVVPQPCESRYFFNLGSVMISVNEFTALYMLMYICLFIYLFTVDKMSCQNVQASFSLLLKLSIKSDEYSKHIRYIFLINITTK